MSPKEIKKPVFSDFPQDHRYWWIRWVDDIYLAHRGTASTGVTVYLSPLDKPPNRISAKEAIDLCRRDRRGGTPCGVHVGSMPAMAIGTIIHEQEPQGTLPLEVREISWDGTTSPPVLVRNSTQLNGRPEWSTDENMRNFALGHWEYPLPASAARWLLYVRDRGCDCLIPCPEILRTFYAWHTYTARAITNEPWGQTYEKLVDLESLGETEDGKWCLIASTGFNFTDCKRLAQITIDPEGFRSATEIYTNLWNAAQNAGPASIKADLPCRSRPWRLKAKGVYLHYRSKAKFLAMQICEWKWPYPERGFRYGLKNSSAEGGVILLGGIRRKPSKETTGSTMGVIQSDLDSQEGKEVSNYESPACRVVDIDEEPVRKDKSHRYIRIPSHLEPHGQAIDASSGNSSRSTRGLSRAVLEAGRSSLPGKFEIALEAFRTLQETGEISDFQIIEPSVHRADLSGGKCGWFVPNIGTMEPEKGSAWRFVSFEGHSRFRTAIVLRAKVLGVGVNFLELEPRPREAHRALIFRHNGDLQRTIHRNTTWGHQEAGLYHLA